MSFSFPINSFSQDSKSETGIIFHDYQPNIVLKNAYSDTLIIDINHDNINDVMFYLGENSTGNWSKVKTINPQCQFSEVQYYPSDSLKSSSLSWLSGDFFVLGFEEFNFGIKMGIKISSNGLNYYGWIKVSNPIIDRIRVVIIDKYAFCTIPNYPLLWGQTEITGVEILKNKDKIKVFTNEQGNSISVQADELIKNIKLLNLFGVEVKNLNPKQTKNVNIDTLGIPGGAYLVQVTLISNKVYTEKIVLP